MAHVMEKVKHRTIRLYWWVGVVCLIALIVASAPVSRLAINPVIVEVRDAQVTSKRTFPSDYLGLDRPRLSYTETVKGFSSNTNDGHVCFNSGGPFRYVNADEIGQWSIAWAKPCTSDPLGYTWEACWQWHLGALRFGAVCQQFVRIKGD